jgi:ankyrin repeat protein
MRQRGMRRLFICCLLSAIPWVCCGDGIGQGVPRRCEKVPAGNWSITFGPYAGPGHESSPYQIISMNVEACGGYLYLGDVSLSAPPNRPFFTIEYSAFVYKAAEPDRLLFRSQIYRMGNGDGDFDAEGVWRTTAGKRWGAPFTAGDAPLMQPLMRDGTLEGEYRVEIGISLISFGRDDVWDLGGRQKTADSGKALLEAADDFDNVGAVRSLIADGADVNARNAYNETPLMRAGSHGYTKTIRLLIKSGADVNAKSADGYTPLILSAQYGYADAVRLLLEAGADLRAKNNDGMSALFSAGSQGRGETWDLLKGAGAESDSPADEMLGNAGLGRTEVVEKLIAGGVSADAKGPRDYTALLLASLNGHADTVRFLLAHGADANIADKYGWPPLKWALFAHHPEIMRMLIRVGADVNFRDLYGATPLITAVQCLNVEGAQLLVESGADVSARDGVGKTALDYAVEKANTGPVQVNDPMVKLLKSAAAKVKL